MYKCKTLFNLNKQIIVPVFLCFQVIIHAIILLLMFSCCHAADAESQNHPEKSTQKASTQPVEVAISITGIEGELKQNALAYLELKKSLNDPHFSKAWLQRLHKKAEKNIKDALQPFGYYQTKVTGTLQQTEDSSWLAQYTVVPGKQVKITEVNIVITGPGKNDPEILALIDNFPIKKGDPLDHTQYEEAKANITTGIGRLGYSQITTHSKKVLVDTKNNTANINLEFASGTKFFLGTIHFHQDMLNEDFILSYLQNIKTGDPLSQNTLLELQHALYSSGYFSLVDIKPDFEHVKNRDQVPVNITLKPAKRHKISFGIGYDTEIEANVSMRWQHRRLNRYGHYGDILTKLAPKKSTFRVSYWIPTGDPSRDKYGIITSVETEDTDTTDRTTFDLETGYWFAIKEWENTLFTEYRLEDFVTGNDPSTTTELLSFGARTQRVNYEQGLFPRRGWSVYGEIRGAAEQMLSDIDYLRLYLKSRLLLPVTRKGRLVLRAELGMAESNDYDSYPSSLRFYAGGDQSVRGYDWKALGPKDREGNVIGGRNVVTGSLEYDHQVAENWVVAGFYDAGNAYNDSLDTVYYGAGFGIRYISPIGLIKTDIGFPLKSDDDISDNNFVFYFGFEMNL